MWIYQRFLFALVYSVFYFGLALENVGAEGKGSLVFFAPAITWVLVLTAIFLLSKQLSQFRKIFVSVLLGIHYGVTVLSIFNYWTQDEGHLLHSWNKAAWAVTSAIAWYLLGQFAIWIVLYRSKIYEGELH
jgi:hypothetical protein